MRVTILRQVDQPRDWIDYKVSIHLVPISCAVRELLRAALHCGLQLERSVCGLALAECMAAWFVLRQLYFSMEPEQRHGPSSATPRVHGKRPVAKYLRPGKSLFS